MIVLFHTHPFFCFSQKFYDEKNKKLDTGPADLMRHEDVKTTSTRKLLPSGKVTGNDNGIPVIPSILNSVPSASGVPHNGENLVKKSGSNFYISKSLKGENLVKSLRYYLHLKILLVFDKFLS